jgi:type I restriction-modification system DNA methylase subunit
MIALPFDPKCASANILRNSRFDDLTNIDLEATLPSCEFLFHPYEPTIQCENSLTNPLPESTVHFFMSNSPFSLKVNDWEFKCGKTFKSEAAFIEYGLNTLKPDGVLSMIVPNSLLANHREKIFREYLLKNHRLLASISLPTETFYHAGTAVKTAILMLKKGRGTEEDYKIMFAVCENIGWDSRGRPTDQSDLEEISQAYLTFEKERGN